MKYVSLDLETTGLDTSTCQILEVGMIVDDLEWPEVIRPGPYGGRPHIRILVNNGPLIKGEYVALQANQALLKEIAEGGSGMSVSDADFRLAWFMGQHFDGVALGKGKATAVGKNVASFDIPFLKSAGFKQTCFALHHRSVDPAMLYWEPGDQGSPSLSQCLKRAGIIGEVAHTAEADAWQVCQLIRNKLVGKRAPSDSPFTEAGAKKAREIVESLPPSHQSLLHLSAQSTNSVPRDVVVGLSCY